MTDFDKKLIEKARTFSRYNYNHVDILAKIADTDEARKLLMDIRWELYDSVLETL